MLVWLSSKERVIEKNRKAGWLNKQVSDKMSPTNFDFVDDRVQLRGAEMVIESSAAEESFVSTEPLFYLPSFS